MKTKIAKSLRSLLLIPLMLARFGLAPMAQAVGPDTDGAIPGSNNGEGTGVLVSRTTGVWNTGTGFEALSQLTAGNQNTATGLRALNSDTNGGFNTATGVLSLFSNTSGFFNSATGAYALANNTIASYNTANGYGALYFNTEGDQNTAIGFGALFINTTGRQNVAVGVEALNRNTTGGINNAVGYLALNRNTTGGGNNAVGEVALFSNVTGHDNTAIGDTTRIQNVYSSVASTRAVYVDSDNKIGTLSSSRRYKDEIRPMAKASETILSLRPVSFRYKKEVNPTRSLSFGLIAEEVAQVDPDLVTPDRDGKPETVRYDAVNAMLLNEFLKEHRTVQELKSNVARQEAIIAEQQKQIKALTSGLEKVNNRLELNKPARQIVANTPKKGGPARRTDRRLRPIAPTCLQSAVMSHPP